ncbi:MAG: efflux RND transporter permease subunit, partial [Desulfocapsa sp.]|nr:efflux RND transporter permease subunit [Desulfocapsa sp.]
DHEISVEISQNMLRAYSLTPGSVAQTIRNTTVELPGGVVKTPAGDILIRVKERNDYADEFARIPIITANDGTEVLLEDIAVITEGFEETDQFASFNGKPAIMLRVYRVGDQTPISVSDAVKLKISEIKKILPAGLSIEARRDRSDIYRQRLELMLHNGYLGLGLVFILLAVFLEARLAFWVSLGIPISFLGSLLILPALGMSINMISMFAFIITLGIVVDDAVVVGENIFYKRKLGLPPLQAAIEGAQEMSAPVFIAVATNIIAFLPLFFVSGSTGRFFEILPAVVIAVFLISLVECLFVLPAHLSYRKTKKKSTLFKVFEKVPRFCDQQLDQFVKGPFASLLRWNLTSRYLVAAIGLAVLITSYSYWDSGWINFSFRPKIQTDSIDAEIELPYGV